MYFTLATLTTASTFEPFRQTPRGRTLGRKFGSLPSASSLGSFVITSAAGCPFCNTMMTDGVKVKENQTKVLDVAELIANAQDL